MNLPKKSALALALVVTLASCSSEPAAKTANDNLSKAADNFEVARRIVGINGITDKVLFEVDGFCSLDPQPTKLEVICLLDRKTGAVERTTLGISNNVTYVSTQIGGADVSLFHPRIIFRPETIIPNFDLSTSIG
jgi:hypothetical protein